MLSIASLRIHICIPMPAENYVREVNIVFCGISLLTLHTQDEYLIPKSVAIQDA